MSSSSWVIVDSPPSSVPPLEVVPSRWSPAVSQSHQNGFPLLCPFCSTIVLSASTGHYHIEDPPLRLHRVRLVVSPQISFDDQIDSLSDFFVVESQFAFENVAVTRKLPELPMPTDVKEVEKEKMRREKYDLAYLACASCDQGPLGLVQTEKETRKQQYLVAAERMKYGGAQHLGLDYQPITLLKALQDSEPKVEEVHEGTA